ncbi:MAG: helix-turn-helix transcriptional regulator [Acidobacteria bacterium]|nr:helix-turn-helix transcriptional regulator [Acidobacteriota bacterium]
MRQIRDQLGLTMRDVESASARISALHGSEEYLIPPSRLSDIETKGVVPSVFRFYSLAAIYRRPIRDLLLIYGIDLSTVTNDWSSSRPANSHISGFEEETADCNVPIRFDPGFDLRETSDLRRMVQEWGPVPFTFLNSLASQKYTYAFVGTEDYTMYPLLQPGSFIQVDESKRRVVSRPWRSEYERPIYFVETREGFVCCWCSLRLNSLVLQPHPLSSAPVRVLKHPQEAEVIGQVVGVAMKIGDPQSSELLEPRGFARSTADGVVPTTANLRVADAPVIPSATTRRILG